MYGSSYEEGTGTVLSIAITVRLTYRMDQTLSTKLRKSVSDEFKTIAVQTVMPVNVLVNVVLHARKKQIKSQSFRLREPSELLLIKKLFNYFPTIKIVESKSNVSCVIQYVVRAKV